MNITGMPWFLPLPIIILCICLGILVSGFLVMTYVFFVEKKGLYGAIALLSILGISFIGNELGVILCSFAGKFTLGKQFHRAEALSAAAFIFALPFYVSFIFESNSRLKRFNAWVIRVSAVAAAAIFAVAFLKPELFLDLRWHIMEIKPWNGGRGIPGPIYVLRDCLIALLGLYSFSLISFEYWRYRQKRHLLLTLCGTACGVFSGVFDVVMAQIERATGLFSIRSLSFFGIGLTLFAFSCMIGVLNWFVAQAKTIGRAQKLEALSLLAGGIAHDFNNILCGILGNAALLKDTVDKRGNEALNEIEKAVMRARALSGQMITYARGGVQKRIAIDIAPLVREIAAASFADCGVTFGVNFEIGLWRVFADPIQIGQVVQNVLLNAKEAMNGRGRVLIRAENNYRRGTSSSKAAGRFVNLRIRDSGPGIPKENEKKIFDPYFSTKDKGTGLGLSVCWAILESHGGSIELLDDAEEGAEFLISLPAV